MSDFDLQGLAQVSISTDIPAHRRIVDGAISEITTLRQQLKQAEARVAELEADNLHQRERRNAARDCIQKMKAESLRKQAEAVDEAREHMLRDAARGTGMNVDDANAWLKVKVQWLRDEAEWSNDE